MNGSLRGLSYFIPLGCTQFIRFLLRLVYAVSLLMISSIEIIYLNVPNVRSNEPKPPRLHSRPFYSLRELSIIGFHYNVINIIASPIVNGVLASFGEEFACAL